MADIPTSRFGRFARLASLGARAGGERVATLLGSKTAQAEFATAAADALGTMRGLALKLGQMASYVDGFVPEDQREVYEAAMRTLRAAAPTMSPEAASRVVEQELGAPPDKLFASWEAEPFAAASIGQVHRATTTNGREVAVKVQYEGVARAVKSDLKNASLFTTLAGPLGAKFDAKGQYAEMRARFEEELDYVHEARAQQRFVDIFRADSKILIPGVVSELSSARVLTTELARGVDFEAACRAPEADRRAWAETLWRFVFTSLLVNRLFNADPHPGNYLFAVGGAVHFFDFGCTRDVKQERMNDLRGAHMAAAGGDDDEFVIRAAAMLDMPRGGEQERIARGYLLQCFEPIRAKGPYRMTHAFARSLFDGMRENAEIMLRSKKGQFAALPAEWLFFNRLQLGFYSVLARLDVEVDYTAVEREIFVSFDEGR